jgi:mono/diheme cytochrome c family protein
MYGVPHTTMPAQFYVVTNEHFEPLVPDPADRIGIIAGHLFSLNVEKRRALEDHFNRARQSATNITADLGRALFVGLNCAACHRNALTPQATDAAPDLTQEASRVKRTWLERYLRKPVPIRPAGFQPGSGSRMPDFRLSDAEIGEVVAVLAFEPPKRDGQQGVISAFAQHKARTLLADKLSCLGCHRFGEKGGRIGPDLTTARDRLQPDYLLQMIQNPRGANPHAIMPRVPMTPQLLHLITDFLLRHDQSPSASSYLSFVDHPLGVDMADAPQDARYSYLRQCTPCHGSNGDGNGFNARYLPRKPTVHADNDYMSRRPDDTLFDGIYSGAGILSKSPYMPPWGETLSREEITAMVHHLRELCRCDGPAWSRDGKR